MTSVSFPLALEFEPLTPDRWRDVVKLFGPRGACAGCWCMVWRRARGEWERGKGSGNRAAFQRVVRQGLRREFWRTSTEKPLPGALWRRVRRTSSSRARAC